MGIVTKTFTADGSWTCPAGVKYVIIWAQGGGGGASGGASDNPLNDSTNLSGSGSSLGYQAVPVTPGTTYSITIGLGGDGGLADQPGANGGDTSFDSYTFHGSSGGAFGISGEAYMVGISGGGGQDYTGAAGAWSPYYFLGAFNGDGGGGGRGNGGNGWTTTTDGSDGSAPDTPNSGAGGGRGANNIAVPGAGGLGGDGGDGWLQIIWFD